MWPYPSLNTSEWENGLGPHLHVYLALSTWSVCYYHVKTGLIEMLNISIKAPLLCMQVSQPFEIHRFGSFLSRGSAKGGKTLYLLSPSLNALWDGLDHSYAPRGTSYLLHPGSKQIGKVRWTDVDHLHNHPHILGLSHLPFWVVMFQQSAMVRAGQDD